MPSERKFYANKVTITVLSEDAPLSQDADLQWIADYIDTGDGVGGNVTVESKEVPPKDMATLLNAYGSEALFFRLDNNGEDHTD